MEQTSLYFGAQSRGRFGKNHGLRYSAFLFYFFDSTVLQRDVKISQFLLIIKLNFVLDLFSNSPMLIFNL